MQNVVRFEPLHEAISDQLVVLWALQVLGNGLERHEEAAEVFELIKLFDCGKGCVRRAVTLREFKQSRRQDRAFEVQVQLGFGQGEDGATGHHIHDCRF